MGAPRKISFMTPRPSGVKHQAHPQFSQTLITGFEHQMCRLITVKFPTGYCFNCKNRGNSNTGQELGKSGELAHVMCLKQQSAAGT